MWWYRCCSIIPIYSQVRLRLLSLMHIHVWIIAGCGDTDAAALSQSTQSQTLPPLIDAYSCMNNCRMWWYRCCSIIPIYSQVWLRLLSLMHIHVWIIAGCGDTDAAALSQSTHKSDSASSHRHWILQPAICYNFYWDTRWVCLVLVTMFC